MLGTLVNVFGILVGGAVGLAGRKPLSPATESFFKVILAVLTVSCGLRLTWQSLGGSFGHVLKQLALVIVALMLGKLAGGLLHLQAFSNHLGRLARDRISAAEANRPKRVDEGFKTCAALFCAAPLGILGAVQEGLNLSPNVLSMTESVFPLAIKAVMDGLACLGLARLFGWGVLLSALPVLAFQGTIAIVCSQWVVPFLHAHGLVNALNGASGLLVFCVALVMLGLKRIALADYLPSLVVAPLLAWWWGW